MMPTPAISLKIKRFRRRFGIAAPRVVVRHHVSWRWYLAGAILVAALAGTLVWVFLERGEAGALSAEVEALKTRIVADEEELRRLRSTAGTGENLAVLERAAQQQLSAQLKRLELENAALREELLLFERLAAVPGEESAPRVESVRIAGEGDGRYRYRILLAFRPTKQVPEFRGRLELRASYVFDGASRELRLPGKGAAAEYVVEVRSFLRREGLLELPPGARLQSLEVRLYHGDTLKAERVARI